jgi:hypothetical protein
MISLGLLVLIDLLMYAIWLWRRGQYENLQLAALPLLLLGIAIMFVGIGAWVGLSVSVRMGTTFSGQWEPPERLRRDLFGRGPHRRPEFEPACAPGLRRSTGPE